MSGSVPFFSIVIPTRNRAHLLPFALESVLQQSFTDFEVIVSDNFSTDSTAEVVQSFNDERIKYFRTNASLPIDGSWNFAISKAQGEFITFLSDDDAYLNFRLQKAFDVLERTKTKLLVHKYAGYYPQGTRFKADKNQVFENNSLTIPWFSGEFAEVKAKKTIQHVYQKIEHYFTHPISAPIYFSDMPHVSDAFYHHSLIESVGKKVPKLINSRQGDIYLGVNVLNEVETYVFLDLPLTVFSTYPEQTTSQSIANGMQGNINKSDAETLFKRVPLKFWTSTNSLADILLEAYEDNESLRPKAKLNWDTYFYKCLNDLNLMEQSGFDVKIYKELFEKKINEYQEKGLIKSTIDMENTRQNSFSLKQKIWESVQNIEIAKNIRMRIDSTANARYWRKVLVDPKKADLNSILDCVKLLDENFIEDIKNFWIKNKLVPNKLTKLI